MKILLNKEYTEKRYNTIDANEDLIDLIDAGYEIENFIGFVEIAKSKIVEQENILPGLDQIDGAAKIEEGLIIIHDIEKCLSVQEGQMLNKAIEKQRQYKVGKKRGKRS